MSSKKWVWIVIAVVVILGALWWGGAFKGSGQSAEVVNGTAQANPQNREILITVAALDVQVAKTQADIKALGSAPTSTQVSTASADLQKAGAIITRLAAQLQPRLTNLKTAGTSVTAAQAALNDLGLQVSNMTSHAGAAGKNATATSTGATLAQSGKQLAAALQYLVSARADIATILKTIGN